MWIRNEDRENRASHSTDMKNRAKKMRKKNVKDIKKKKKGPPLRKKFGAVEKKDEKKMHLRVSPDRLVFSVGSSPKLSHVELKLHNQSRDEDVAFKVRTTLPNNYCVRPKVGYVPAGEVLSVGIWGKTDAKSISLRNCFRVDWSFIPPDCGFEVEKLVDYVDFIFFSFFFYFLFFILFFYYFFNFFNFSFFFQLSIFS